MGEEGEMVIRSDGRCYLDGSFMGVVQDIQVRSAGSAIQYNQAKERRMGKRDAAMHRTRDGEVVALAGMTSSHLVNTIAMFSTRMEEATKLIEQDPKQRTGRQAALYGKEDTTMPPEKYQAMVRGYYERIGPYITEAALRDDIDISKVRNIVRRALGREGIDPMAPGVSIGSTLLAQSGQARTSERALAAAVDDALMGGDGVDLESLGIELPDSPLLTSGD